jgi:hypothetical protein
MLRSLANCRRASVPERALSVSQPSSSSIEASSSSTSGSSSITKARRDKRRLSDKVDCRVQCGSFDEVPPARKSVLMTFQPRTRGARNWPGVSAFLFYATELSRIS